MPQLGGHVSTAGGLWKAFEHAAVLGAQTIQFFGASPRQWNVKLPTSDEVKKFKVAWRKSAVQSVYLHASYLANPASPDEAMRKRAVDNLAAHFRIGEMLGAQGLIFHVGSVGESFPKEGIARVAKAMNEILDTVPGAIKLFIENGSGGGNKIGSSAKEVGAILNMVNNQRAAVCFDTAHALESGIIEKYTQEQVKKLLREWNEYVALSRIEVIHFNDSKSPTGSHYDRHENLGEGYIGLEGLRCFAGQKEIQEKAWILEVPGFDGNGPDVRNMDIMRSLLAGK